MVDIQQCALRTFKQQVLPGLVRLIQRARHVHHQRLDAICQRQRLIQRFLEIHRRGIEIIFQHKVVIVQHLAQLGGQTLAVEQVLQAHAAARHLVFIGRADAAPGGADLGSALGHFARLIHRHVIGQNQRAGFGNSQAVVNIDAGLLQDYPFP